MRVRLQLVENNPLHRVPSLILSASTVQYIFNTIPSLLRHRKIHRINLHKCSHIFFTKNSPETVGGLPNFLLFKNGTQHHNSKVANNIYLYGNTQMIGYLQKLRFKLHLKSLRFSFTNWKKTKYRLGVEQPLFNKLNSQPGMHRKFVKIEDYLKK